MKQGKQLGEDFLNTKRGLVPCPPSFLYPHLFSLEDALLSGNPVRTLVSGISFRLASSRDSCVLIGKNLVDRALAPLCFTFGVLFMSGVGFTPDLRAVESGKEIKEKIVPVCESHLRGRFQEVKLTTLFTEMDILDFGIGDKTRSLSEVVDIIASTRLVQSYLWVANRGRAGDFDFFIRSFRDSDGSVWFERSVVLRSLQTKQLLNDLNRGSFSLAGKDFHPFAEGPVDRLSPDEFQNRVSQYLTAHESVFEDELKRLNNQYGSSEDLTEAGTVHLMGRAEGSQVFLVVSYLQRMGGHSQFPGR